MVITCPSCSARYRLNPDKIQGRGAKITCPKCTHVFVVFTDQDEAASPPEPPPQPRVKTPARPVSSGSLGVHRDSATTTGAFKAVGIEETSAPKRTNTDGAIRVVAPGPRSTRRMRTLDTGEMSAPPPPEVTAPPTPAQTGDVSSAADLDFRSVGIKTWKVKVAIGLIYDFSDIATLKKYLADKKVTPDDLISHNNKDWTRIGDIPDLEEHFISTWKEAKAAVDSGQVSIPEKKKATGTGSHTALGSGTGSHAAVGPATGSFRTADTGSSRALATGAYGAAVDPPPRRRKKKTPPPEEPKRPMGAILAGVLLVGLVIVWRFWPADGPVDTEAPAPLPVSEIKPPDAEMEEIRKNIQDKLKKAQEEAAAQAAIPEEPEETTDSPVADRLVPVPPSEQTIPVQKDPIRDPIRQPPAGQYSRPRYEAPKAQKQPEGSSGEVREKRSDPAKMYYDAGQKKLAAGDNGSAQKMFLQAIKKDPGCGHCYAGLAEAEKQLGNADAAAAAAKKASELGSPTSRTASP